MAAWALRRLFAPENMIKESLLRGELPPVGEAYSTAFKMAWPSISETFLIALISMADTVMVGAVGPKAIAAVGLATQPRFLVLALIMSLNIATTSICARRKGEGDHAGAVRCLKQSLVLTIIISLAISTIALIFSRELLMLAGAQPDTIDDAKTYFDIILMGIPVNALLLTISAAQRGIGQTRVSMYINMLSNVVNLVLNYLLIGGRLGFPRLEVRGAAIATVAGMLCGLVLAVASIASPNRPLSIFSRDGWGFDRKTLSSLYVVASGSFADQICMRIGFFIYAVIIARLGTLMFAAHQVLMNILSLSFSLGEGFGIAASSLVGQNMGAKRPDLSIIYGKICQRMSFITSIIIFFIFLFFGRPMILMFTDEQAILEVGKTVLLLMGAIVFAQTSQMVMLGCLRGAGDTRYTAVVSLVCIVLLRPALAWVFAYPLGWGLIGAWIGLLLDQYLRLALTLGRFSSGKWMSIEL